MDVNYVNSIPNQKYLTSSAKEIPAHDKVAVNTRNMPEIENNTMMDLQEMKNFLYMLIGSHLKVESKGSFAGINVNKMA